MTRMRGSIGGFLLQPLWRLNELENFVDITNTSLVHGSSKVAAGILIFLFVQTFPSKVPCRHLGALSIAISNFLFRPH